MNDIMNMEELDHPKNMQELVNKLPFKMRDAWRRLAFNISDNMGRRVKFTDLVDFVDHQAKILNDPVFGSIQDKDKKSAGISNSKGKKFTKSNSKGSFATNVNDAISAQSTEKSKAKPEGSQNTESKSSNGKPPEKTCLYCSGNHTIEFCRRLRYKPHGEKVDFLKSKGLCFSCLQRGHLSKSCVDKLTCQICKLQHPTVLHRNLPPNANGTTTSQDPPNQGHVRSGCTSAGVECAMSIVPVIVKAVNSDKTLNTYAFLDTGSSASFCTEGLMRELNMQGSKTKINVSTITDQAKPVDTYIVKGLEISSLDCEKFVKLPSLYTQKMPVSSKDIPSQEDIDKWPHLRDIKIPSIDAEIDLLIGNNCPLAMEPWEVVNCDNNGPYAVKTILGWSINGPLKEGSCEKICSISVNKTSVEPNLEQQLRNYYNTDFSERLVNDVPENSQEDERFLKLVSESVRLKDGHYEIGLPFKEDNVVMPNNRRQAEQRLALLKKKFSKNENFYQEYKVYMQDMFDKGYARQVPEDQLTSEEGKKWYLPHHAVFHPTKKKLRVVFDCGAQYGSTSLNEQLLQGPNLTNSLLGTLLKFRQDDIAMIGDIEAMFLQVKVPDKDASFLRFLWFEDGDPEKPVIECQTVIHLFGATSSPSCANYALRKTAEDNRELYSEEVVETILNNFYVDDCLKNKDSVWTAIPLIADVVELCRKGGFRLTKWVSNSRLVMASIGEEELAKELRDLDLQQDDIPMERALGVQWNPESDKLGFKIVEKNKPATRRGMLSLTSSVYDPLGLLGPFLLKAKIIQQDTCRLNLGWDDEIPEKHKTEWENWTKDLPKISDFQVDRSLKPKDFGQIQYAQLHHFSDASQLGYGTVSYLRLVNTVGRVHCALIICKSRVAPLKNVTIPRLELNAAAIAVKVDTLLRKELDIPIEKSCFWTDSTAVLKYIRNQSARFHTFVANRLQIIRDGSHASRWYYIESKLNPADIASRGQSADEFLRNHTWIEGPSFLWKVPEDWPAYPQIKDALRVSSDDPEVKSCVTIVPAETPIGNGADAVNRLLNYHSSWYRLKKSVAWILKVRKELLRRCKQKETASVGTDTQTDRSKLKSLTVQDLNDAESAILNFVQRQAFPDEMSTLSKGQSQRVKKSSRIAKLSPTYDDNLLRVGGRLERAAMPEEMKHPVILPKGHHVSQLIIRHTHHVLGHTGRNHMLSRLRQKYWITQANSAVRKVIKDCVICKRQNAKVGEQLMANLPKDRLIPDEPVFTRTGVDFFGPIQVKRGRATVKRYGALFTCLSTCAVHIEVADSLDTDSCINAIRRFIARRGLVKKFRSDRGTNFVSADRELKESLRNIDDKKIQQAMLKYDIDWEWEFNPPAAPHHGGIWERQIKTVKRILKTVLREQTVDDENLRTLLCEIESIVNDRPITRNSDDPSDLEALTPNHLLLLKTKPSLPPGVFSKDDVYAKRRWRQVQYLAELFWKRWSKEYLVQLQERQKWVLPRRNFESGDIVLIVDENAPRNSWPLAKVIETFPDKRGYVRKVKVRTKFNTVLERPVCKLCLLLEKD